MSLVKRHPIITFFVVTYALTWGFLPLGIFLPAGPLLAALIVIPITQGRAGLKELGLRMIRWRVGWIWFAVALGLPLGVHLVTMVLNIPFAGVPSLAFSSLTTFLVVFAVRLVNPLDGPLGEEPGWRGFALPGLQSTLSPLVSTLILAVLITGWHLPLFFFEPGGLQPSFIVTAVLGTVAVTFWYTWLFNHTGGSVLLVLVAHSIEGSIQAGGWIYMGVWCAVAIGLVVFDWKAWRGAAPAETAAPPLITHPKKVQRRRNGMPHIAKTLGWAAIVLSVIILLLSASVRLAEMAQPPPTPDAFGDRYVEHPWVALIHIVPGLLFLTLAPLQFVARIRRRHIGFHRGLGRILAACAAISGLFALLVAILFPAFGGITTQAATGFFGAIFLFSLAKAIFHIRRKEVRLHREWMIRTFALALAVASIRVFTALLMMVSDLGFEEAFGVSFWLGFGVNLLVAEVWINYTRATGRVASTAGS